MNLLAFAVCIHCACESFAIWPLSKTETSAHRPNLAKGAWSWLVADDDACGESIVRVFSDHQMYRSVN